MITDAITREALEFMATEKPCRKGKAHAWQLDTLMQMKSIEVDGLRTADIVLVKVLRCVYCRVNLLWTEMEVRDLDEATGGGAVTVYACIFCRDTAEPKRGVVHKGMDGWMLDGWCCVDTDACFERWMALDELPKPKQGETARELLYGD